jgi:hypothetical protein
MKDFWCEKGVWKLPLLWKSAKNADFHNSLKRASQIAQLFHSYHSLDGDVSKF